jgi:hypothetical protein
MNRFETVSVMSRWGLHSRATVWRRDPGARKDKDLWDRSLIEKGNQIEIKTYCKIHDRLHQQHFFIG